MKTPQMGRFFIFDTMKKSIVAAAGIQILVAVVLGAMGAHALKGVLSADEMVSYSTATNYLMYMGLGQLILGFNYSKFRKIQFRAFYFMILVGTLLFSGSIYLLLISEALEIRRILGPVTPLGGTLIILGWLYFILQFAFSLGKTNAD
jgi:uncharacterized membrane protein YgdD (TMEM256/DUF423 family)